MTCYVEARAVGARAGRRATPNPPIRGRRSGLRAGSHQPCQLCASPGCNLHGRLPRKVAREYSARRGSTNVPDNGAPAPRAPGSCQPSQDWSRPFSSQPTASTSRKLASHTNNPKSLFSSLEHPLLNTSSTSRDTGSTALHFGGTVDDHPRSSLISGPEGRPRIPSRTSILVSIVLLLPRYRLCLEYTACDCG